MRHIGKLGDTGSVSSSVDGVVLYTSSNLILSICRTKSLLVSNVSVGNHLSCFEQILFDATDNPERSIWRRVSSYVSRNPLWAPKWACLCATKFRSTSAFQRSDLAGSRKSIGLDPLIYSACRSSNLSVPRSVLFMCELIESTYWKKLQQTMRRLVSYHIVSYPQVAPFSVAIYR